MSANKRKQENAVIGDTSRIWCAPCDQEVWARLTTGAEIYPRRPDLHKLPIWKCDGCGGYVGCHHKHHIEAMRTRPLGVIATAELKAARSHLHRLIDPLWETEDAPFERRDLYAEIAARMSWHTYHTAEIKTLEHARAVYRVVLDIKRELAAGTLTRKQAA